MAGHCRHRLLSVIIFALVFSPLLADELDDPLEPGKLEFVSKPPDVPEPGQTIFIDPSSDSGPPEPSTRPHFTNGSTSIGGPPEPSTRPHFSGNPEPINPGPPEPSTRPHFSGASAPAGPPEPSTRPHFESTRDLQGPPEPSIRNPFGSGNAGPPEPSTRPHFSEGASAPLPSGPPEPSNRPQMTGTNPQTWGPPLEPNQNYYNQLQPVRAPTSTTPRPRNRARPLYTSYYTSPVVNRDPVDQPLGYPRSRYDESSTPGYHHLYDHPSLVNTRLDRPFTQPVWRCDIAINRCFLRNKVNFVPFQTQYNFEGTPIALVLDVGTAARRRHQLTRRPNPVYAYSAARLETTSYYPAQYADACIVFSYFWNGAGRKHLHVLQRNQEDVCIYSAELNPNDPNTRGTSGVWQDVQLQVDLRYGPAKFWIEYQFDLGAKRDYYAGYDDLGYLAIRNFTIGYGTCQNSRSEECDVPSSR